MKIKETGINGLSIIEPSVFEDKRGYFFESYNRKMFLDSGFTADFVQDNQSRSTYGVIRGLHMQVGAFAQCKLVRVTEGSIFDVAVDFREDSPTFGKWYGVELSAEKRNQLYIPKGFAHGFSVLSDHATVFYKCDEFYNKEAERGIRFDDPDLNINWQIPDSSISISEKDSKLPLAKELFKI